MAAELYRGDSKLVPFQLYQTTDGAKVTFDMSSASDVRLLLRKGATLLSSELVCLIGTTGADWATAYIVADMDSTFTSGITLAVGENQIQAEVNIRVTLGGRPKTWRIDEPLVVFRELFV